MGYRLSVFFLIAILSTGAAAEEASGPVGIDDKKLGSLLPINDLAFAGEEGERVVLADLFDRPVVLTLVYFRCPRICTLLLSDLAKAVEMCDLTPGEDYRLVTVSFDPREKPDMARNKRANMIAEIEKRTVSPSAWRFLTGDEENIRKITDEAGFRYIPDKNKMDWIHPVTVIVVSADGKIVRYLNPMPLNPVDLKMAVIDAKQGRSRPMIQALQRLCYSYESSSRAYQLRINRIVLWTTVIGMAALGWFLIFRRRKKPPPGPAPVGGSAP
jgi:protein SCO1